MIFHAEGDILDLVKLDPMGLVGTLDIALKLRGSRRDNEETDPPDPAGLFEVLLELRATIDLDGPDREGELAFHVLQEQSGGEARGVPIGSGDIPAGDEVSGAELPAPAAALEVDLKSIDLDKVPRGCDPISFRLADGITGPAPPFPGLLSPANVDRLHQHPAGLEPLHHPANFPPQENHQLVLPPTGILRPELEDPILDRGRGQGLADVLGPPAFGLQRCQILWVEPVLPAVEGLGGDIKVAAGQPGIAVTGIMVHPA
jgi:hypothetical protein